MEWLPVEVQGNRRLANRWLGWDMRHGLSSHNKSIRVGDMKYTLPHLMYMSVQSQAKRLIKWLFCHSLCECVCVWERERNRHMLHSHTNTGSPVILTESFRQLGWNHIPLKWKTSLTQGTSLLLIFPLFVAAERQYLRTPWRPLGAIVWTGISFSSADILWASRWLCHKKKYDALHTFTL